MENKEPMIKKNRKISPVAFGALCAACCMFAMTLWLYVLDRCTITDANRQNGYFNIINPFEEADSFRSSNLFFDQFFADTTHLTRQSAICRQIETAGRYDGEKTIDVIDYYYRKNKTDIPEKYRDLHIEYRVADLIEWNKKGFHYDTVSKEEWLVSESDSVEEYEQEAGSESFSRIYEFYLPTDGVSLYERDYPVGTDRIFASDNVGNTPSLAMILESDIYDLAENYTKYMQDLKWLTADQNLKFAVFDPEGRLLKSNLHLSAQVSGMDRESRNKALIDAFTSQKTYCCYEFGKVTVPHGNLGNRTESDFLTIFRDYEYAFESGSCLYVCVLDEKAEDSVLGSYVPTDCYGRADAIFTEVSGKMNFFLIGFAFLMVIALVSFVAFTISIPAKEKNEMKGFHKIPTLLAAGIMMILGSIIIIPLLASADYYDRLSARIASPIDYFYVLLWLTMLLEMPAFLYGWYSLVLRIKSKTLISNSLTVVLIRFVKRFVKRLAEGGASFFQKQKNILLRNTLPFVLYLLVNFLFLAVATNIHPFSALCCLIFNTATGIFLYHQEKSRRIIAEGIDRIVEGDLDYQIDTAKMFDGNKKTAEQVNRIGGTISAAVEKSMQDERMKTELITNVSHDIKTPLTSVINYVDLLKREDIDNEKAQEYIRVLDEKSNRLKALILDLVEASKISSGNITLENVRLDMRELLSQSLGEFEDKLAKKNLSVVYRKPEEEMCVFADPARMWRVLENLMGNVCKYAMPGSRVYAELTAEEKAQGQPLSKTVLLTIKNVSQEPLNISAEELTERFVRGDAARSSEGSGLGLSIARDLVTLMKGSFEIYLDGDLFKVCVRMPMASDSDAIAEEQPQ